MAMDSAPSSATAQAAPEREVRQRPRRGDDSQGVRGHTDEGIGQHLDDVTLQQQRRGLRRQRQTAGACDTPVLRAVCRSQRPPGARTHRHPARKEHLPAALLQQGRHPHARQRRRWSNAAQAEQRGAGGATRRRRSNAAQVEQPEAAEASRRGWSADDGCTHGTNAETLAVHSRAALGVCQPRQQAAPRPAAADGLGVQSRPVEHRQADDAVARGAAVAKGRDRRRDSDALR